MVGVVESCRRCGAAVTWVPAPSVGRAGAFVDAPDRPDVKRAALRLLERGAHVCSTACGLCGGTGRVVARVLQVSTGAEDARIAPCSRCARGRLALTAMPRDGP